MIFVPPVTPELEAGVIEKGSEVEWSLPGYATKTFTADADFFHQRFASTSHSQNPLFSSQLSSSVADRQPVYWRPLSQNDAVGGRRFPYRRIRRRRG
ncbi:MAG TPA: hypothetical protein VGM73_15170, partial [Candidatus Didemnitutus sp.]